MYVGSFPSHSVQKAHLFARSFQSCKFDPGAVGTEATDDPMSAELNEWVGTANGAADDRLVENF
jgi:hypothetical protein